MRKTILLIWLLVPVLVGAYHYGPGQDRMVLDEIDAILSRADADAASENWADAVEGYEEALAELPADRKDVIRRVRIERAKAQMFVSKLPEARRDLEMLLEELVGDDDSDPEQLADAREALANSKYYMTWLMRLEGQPQERWEPEIESARQTYRLLAEQADDAGRRGDARRHREDLESTVRLARMELGELQGLPLPSQ